MQQFVSFYNSLYWKNTLFTFLPPYTTCFGLAGHLQVCLTRIPAPSAMQWSASASGFTEPEGWGETECSWYCSHCTYQCNFNRKGVTTSRILLTYLRSWALLNKLPIVRHIPADRTVHNHCCVNLESNMSCLDLQRDLVVTLQEKRQRSLDAPSSYSYFYLQQLVQTY
jgi:hypothetical protein